MAKSFIYDSIGFSEASTEDGGFVAGAFDPDISPVPITKGQTICLSVAI